MKLLKSLLLVLILGNGLYAETPALFTDKNASIDARMTLVAEYSHPVTQEEEKLIHHVKFAISQGENEISDLPSEVLEIPGMSSTKGRCFLNALCTLPETRYLEIGCWKGSTFVSALIGNQESVETAIGIDDWSQFQSPYRAFESNCRRFLADIPYHFYSHDCFSIDPTEFIDKKINIYFYDGGHKEEEQAKAFLFFDSVLEDVYIGIVDDWNWAEVREGTFRAFRELGYTVLYEASMPAAKRGEDRKEWWNGCYVAVIRKAEH